MTRVTGAFRYRTTTIMAGVFAGLIVTPPQQLLGQSTVMTPGMTAGTIPAASASATISSTNATISNTGSVANIANVGSLSGSGTFTASGLSTVITTAAPPTSNGQGLITILVENNGSSAPTSGSLACWDSTSTEVVQAELNADYSLASVPMSLAAATPFSTMQEVGSANCGQLLSPDGMIGDCGVLALNPVYGNCGHLDVDEASQYVTCGNLTSFDFGASGNTFSFLTRRTMIFPLAASILNPAVQVVGPVLITGATSGGASTTKVGVTLLSQ